MVPAGFTSVHIVAVGGKGGASDPGQPVQPGGFGGIATADFAVSPGDTLYVEVGGNGVDSGNPKNGAGGFNGGGSAGNGVSLGAGGGGGASDVRTSSRTAPTAQTLASRVVIAGGGGGGGNTANAHGDDVDARETGGNHERLLVARVRERRHGRPRSRCERRQHQSACRACRRGEPPDAHRHLGIRSAGIAGQRNSPAGGAHAYPRVNVTRCSACVHV